jgi:diguanylate cyclase (GGDEF)-like protein/PAS domain S-box-containing protein
MQPSHNDDFDWRDIYRQYPKATLTTLLLLFVSILGCAIYFWRTNRQMQRNQFERDKLALHLQIANTTLEEKIEQRTRQINHLQVSLQRMLDSMAEGMYGVDTQGNCSFVNAAFLNILGYGSSEEVIGKHIHELIHYAHQDGSPYPSHECRMYQAYQVKEAINVDNEVFWRKDGTSVAVEYWSHPIEEDGEVIGAVATFLDITERKKAEAILLRNKVVIETAQDGFWMVDTHGHLLEVNQAYSKMSGYTKDELLTMHIQQLEVNEVSTDNVKAHISRIMAQGSDQFETRHRRKDGQEIDMEISVTFLAELQLFFVFCRDISERKKAEQEIHQLAFYDILTNLPNRRLLLDRLQMAMAVSERNNEYGAVMFLDLDRFKILNDTKGHDLGDLLLIEVAHRLSSCTRDVDIVARLGGDEFVVVLEMLSHSIHDAATQAEIIGEKIRTTLNQPYQLKNHVHHTTPSIGIVLFKGHKVAMDDLLKHADTAMYQSKTAGRNTIRFYDPALQADLQRRIALELELHQALASQQFRVLYQIQVDHQLNPLGVEALLRWEHPQRGLVSPNEFIFLLEETGLIVPSGLWVFRTACEQLVAWESNPLARHLTLAVNVSAKQFRQSDLVDQLRQILQETGARPELLKLELTESTVLENVEDAIAKMHQLKSLGMSLSMDDFGTGYSSLQYLKRLPLDQIKIDQAFVRDIVSDPDDAAIVQAIIAMSTALGLSVIAEGVEDRTQQIFLEQHGCHVFQGFLFSKPLNAEQFDMLLSQLEAQNIALTAAHALD